jgi:hypothetical protein
MLCRHLLSPLATQRKEIPVMNNSWTEQALAEIAIDTAADVGYEAVRWWLDGAIPHRLLVESRPKFGSPASAVILTAFLPALPTAKKEKAA